MLTGKTQTIPNSIKQKMGIFSLPALTTLIPCPIP